MKLFGLYVHEGTLTLEWMNAGLPEKRRALLFINPKDPSDTGWCMVRFDDPFAPEMEGPMETLDPEAFVKFIEEQE
jgi:hypothetical protein